MLRQLLATLFGGFRIGARQDLKTSPTLLALALLFGMAGLGVLSLFIASWIVGFPPAGSGLRFNGRFLAFGIMAGTAGACGGGLLGLLFGLPTSAARAVAQTNAGANTPGQDNPWFTDNTAMEQIADWLTKIIVGLSLVNFDRFLLRGWQVSIEVSKAMTGLPAAGPAVGGLTLAPAVLIGFAISYIWIRRFLPGELAAARLEMMERQQMSVRIMSGRQKMEAAERAGAKQGAGLATAQEISAKTTRAVAFAAAHASAPLETPPIVEPGPNTLDPWKGQFPAREGQLATVRLDAVVKELPGDPDWFSITLQVALLGDDLGDRPARLYLHPTFPNPIREIRLGKKGYALELVGWGAFTVGLQLMSDERHELDLAELPDAPAVFKAR